MCEPTTAMMVAGGMMAGMAASGMMAPDVPKATPTNPEKPPQAGKAPQVQGLRKDNGAAGGINAGPTSTFLTGSQGVDSSALTLGKNTLLGL